MTVVDFMPHLLSHGPRMNDRQWPKSSSVSLSSSTSRTTCNAAFLAKLIADWIAPSLKSRFEIRQNLLAALRGERPASRDKLFAYKCAWDSQRGALVGATSPQTPRKYNLGSLGDFPRKWKCDPVNAVYLRRFLRLPNREESEFSGSCRPSVLRPRRVESTSASTSDSSRSGASNAVTI